jgi:hypothetical protein
VYIKSSLSPLLHFSSLLQVSYCGVPKDLIHYLHGFVCPKLMSLYSMVLVGLSENTKSSLNKTGASAVAKISSQTVWCGRKQQGHELWCSEKEGLKV